MQGPAASSSTWILSFSTLQSATFTASRRCSPRSLMASRSRLRSLPSLSCSRCPTVVVVRMYYSLCAQQEVGTVIKTGQEEECLGLATIVPAATNLAFIQVCALY